MAGNKRAGYKLATYRTKEGPRAGIVVGQEVFDAAKLTGKAAYTTVAGILADWKTAEGALKKAAATAKSRAKRQPLAKTKFLAPLHPPQRAHSPIRARLSKQPIMPRNSTGRSSLPPSSAGRPRTCRRKRRSPMLPAIRRPTIFRRAIADAGRASRRPLSSRWTGANTRASTAPARSVPGLRRRATLPIHRIST